MSDSHHHRESSSRRKLRQWSDLLLGWWRRVSGSLWLLPGLIALGAAILAVVLIEASNWVDDELLERFPRVFGVAAEGSRSMLATIAGSMITVAGVTFSILVVAVAQASAQFTPRVLRNLMRDRHSQLALGVLTGVFVYCLVVIRTIRGEAPSVFVPSLAVLGAFVLAVVAIGFLVYFIHHIASTLEPGAVLSAVHRDTVDAIDRLFPEPLAEGDASTSFPEAARDEQWRTIAAKRVGYIQHVDSGGMVELAVKHDCVLRMERAIGEFVYEGATLLSVAGAEPDDSFVESVDDLFVLDSYRTVFQDMEFGLRQMVDIALKAMSPGVNDPTTAVSCIHYITAALVKLAGRAIPSDARCVDGRLRVIARGSTFEGAVAIAFDELRRTCAGNARLLVELARAVQRIAECTRSAQRLETLARILDLIEQSARDGISVSADLRLVSETCLACQERLRSRARHSAGRAALQSA